MRGEGVTAVVYRVSRPLVSDAGLSKIPCGVCPVTSSLHHHYIIITSSFHEHITTSSYNQSRIT